MISFKFLCNVLLNSTVLNLIRFINQNFIKMPKIKFLYKLELNKLLIIVLFCYSFVQCFGQKFELSYSPSVFNDNFTGNVIVYLSKENKEPKSGSIGLDVFPCFKKFVKNLKPGESMMIDDNAVGFPTALSDLERGDYYVQIVWDRDMGGRQISLSPGNLFSISKKIKLTKNFSENFKINATEIIPEAKIFTETKYVKELKAPSVLLSDFHKKTMTVNGAVILPTEYYTEPNRKFPVLFIIFGYGGDYRGVAGDNTPSVPVGEIPFIKVYLDGNCSLGHSAYANSDNNGPWGDALVKEFIPILEKKYRCNGAKLLTGHSSGGWSSLWLQTQYPKVFAGCWSSSPDPVDFENFLKINLYKDVNMFYDEKGEQRLEGTVAGRFPWMTMKIFYQMENVIYRGEQMHSFDAVFSKKNETGLPQNLVNGLTGEINKEVFANWKKYDISSFLIGNWQNLKQDLEGKIRISVGKQDNFLLDKSVMLMEEKMKVLNSPIRFAYYNGDHLTVSTPEYRKDGYEFLKEKYLEWLKKTR